MWAGGAGGRSTIARCSRPCLFHEIVKITAGKGKFRIVELTQDMQVRVQPSNVFFKRCTYSMNSGIQYKGLRFALLILLFMIIIYLHIRPG